MTEPVRYLQPEENALIQDRLIEDFRGLRGIRDFNLLASAAARPLNKAVYEEADLPTQAAALLFGLAKAHAFHDSNKRIALQATYMFLRLNGWRFTCSNDAIASFLERGSDSDWTEQVVEAFVRDHTRPGS